eukprot:349697-Chlamydomonas_euryale.AAC.2
MFRGSSHLSRALVLGLVHLIQRRVDTLERALHHVAPKRAGRNARQAELAGSDRCEQVGGMRRRAGRKQRLDVAAVGRMWGG